MPLSQDTDGKAVPATADGHNNGPTEAPKQRRRRRPLTADDADSTLHEDAATERSSEATETKRSGKKAKSGKAKETLSPSWNTSKYRGVTRHRRSGRWEAHIWIGKGVNKQMYLGGYEKEEHAAEAYDMAALKTKGFSTVTNFSKDRYRELEGCLGSSTLEEVVTAVRRQSQGFSRGTSAYRGVSPHPSGRFEARIGIAGNKHVYLGLFNNEAFAARAYDAAVVRIKGSHASTNFSLCDYARELAEHELKQIELQRPQAFQVMSMTLEERLAAGVKLPDTSDVTLADAKVLTASTESTRQRWVRAGFPQAQFEALYASLQQLRGAAGPLSIPMPVKLAADSPTEAAQVAPAGLPASDPSSASSTALAGAAGGCNGGAAPASTADTGSARASAAPAAQQPAADPAPSARASVSSQFVSTVPALATDPAPACGRVSGSLKAVASALGAPPATSSAGQPPVQVAPAALRMFQGDAMSVGMQGPIAAASGSGVPDPQVMQLYLQQIALERAAGMASLGMHMGHGMAFMSGAGVASPLGGLQAVGGSVDPAALGWSGGFSAPVQTLAVSGGQLTGATPSAANGAYALFAPGAHVPLQYSVKPHREFQGLPAGTAAEYGGVWSAYPHAGPTLAYAPMLPGAPQDRRAGSAPETTPPTAAVVSGALLRHADSLQAPSAFTQIATRGHVQLPHLFPPAQPRPPQGGRSLP